MTKREYNIAVSSYSGLLFRYAVKFLRDRAAADDTVQDAFLKLWEHRKNVQARAAKAWLFRTAHNAMVNTVKKAGRSEAMDPERHDRGGEDPHRFELKDAIDHQLATLPPLQRSIILLRDLEGYSYKEIGEMMDVNDSQVKVYLFRARKKMKDALKDVYEGLSEMKKS